MKNVFLSIIAVVEYKYMYIIPINAPTENTILPSPKLDNETTFIITELTIATIVNNTMFIKLLNPSFSFLSQITIQIIINVKNIRKTYLGNKSLDCINSVSIFFII